MDYIGCRITVVATDGVRYTGSLMAFDREMNLILGDAESERHLKPLKGSTSPRLERHAMGCLMIRGHLVESLNMKSGVTVSRQRTLVRGETKVALPSANNVSSAATEKALQAPAAGAVPRL